MPYSLNVNRHRYEAEAPAGTSLLSVLREDMGLTGTRFGCGQGICGACYVLADGQPVPSCMMSVEEAVGKAITTVEGLASGADLHPIQRAFVEEDAMQCGYCISGILISAVALLARTARPSEPEIREALAQHFCRCGVYLRMVRAVQKAAR